MVLGLGSRHKKDRLPPSSIPFPSVDLQLRLLDISPWHASASSSPLLLRWSRGDKPLGSSRVGRTVGEAGKIALDETFRIPVALNRDAGKRITKKSLPDADRPLVFQMLEVNNPKGQPLAHASLDLSGYASIDASETIDVPLTVSKKLSSSKVSIPFLHLTVERYQDRNPSCGAVDAEQRIDPSISSASSRRTSDASSAPPLDEATQEALAAALLSEEEHELLDGEIPHGSSAASQDVVSAAQNASDVRPLETNHSSTISPSEKIDEKQIETIDASTASRSAISPVKAAAAENVAVSCNVCSDPSCSGDHRICIPTSLEVRSPNVYPESFTPASLSDSFSSASKGGSDFVRSIVGEEGEKEVASPSRALTLTSIDGSDFVRSNADAGSAEEIVEVRDSLGRRNAVMIEGPQNDDGKPMLDPVKPSHADTVNRTTDFLGRTNANGSKVEGHQNDDGKSELENHPVKPSHTDVADTKNRKTDLARGNFIEAHQVSNRREISGMEISLPEKLGLENAGKTIKTDSTNSSLAMKSNGDLLETGLEQKPFPKRENDALEAEEVHSNNLIDTTVNFTVQTSVKECSASEAEAKVSKSTGGDNESVAPAEGEAAAAKNEVQSLKMQLEKLEGELRDVAAVEAALYSITAEHGSSSLKVHSPARRLARMYIHACKHWSQERRASCARNMVAGLVLVARACGNDVPRLTFWWSNAAVLRETILMAFDVLPSSPGLEIASGRSKSGGASTDSEVESVNSAVFEIDTRLHDQQDHASPTIVLEDWSESSTLTAALEKVEAWIYVKVVESVWWQVLMPRMQRPPDVMFSESAKHTTSQARSNRKRLDEKHRNMSIEIWMKAFSDAYERICPVRAVGVECGCLPMLSKMVLEECAVRLDVAMFNAILRGYDGEAPTDPISDPITDAQVLPIPTSCLSFGLGAQLKNAVGILSAWIADLLSKDADDIIIGRIPEDDKNSWIIFPLLKATGDLLMLPKDMLRDKSLRKEVCPTLSLPFIGRILLSFKPDEFCPEPVTDELLETINSEISVDNQVQGGIDCNITSLPIASAPRVLYSPPKSKTVRNWIGDPATYSRFGRSNSSLLRKGHTSDDEIDELESPISWLLENTVGLISGYGGSTACQGNSNRNGKGRAALTETGTNCRFQLLREVWNAD